MLSLGYALGALDLHWSQRITCPCRHPACGRLIPEPFSDILS